MSLALIGLPSGLLLLTFGIILGCWNWMISAKDGIAFPDGTVMLSALPALMVMQFLLAFPAFDISSTPRKLGRNNWS